MITDLQKKSAQAIVTAFETGSLQGDYGKVVFHSSDPGGLTYGKTQTTIYSGNLYLLIKAYVEQPNADYADELRPYLKGLKDQDSRLNRDRTLRSILQEAGDDPIMQATQDEFFDRVYWAPTVKSAEYIGIQTALGYSVVYDGRIHGSWHMIRDRTIKNYGQLSSLGEQTWITRYIQTRKSWLGNHSNSLLRLTVYRMDTFNELINAGNWALALPFHVRGLRVDAAALSPNVSISAELAPDRLLKVETPYLRGEDVRQVQLALIKAGFSVETDSVYGPGTAEVVKQWQAQQGLTPDGIVGSATRSALGIDDETPDTSNPALSNPTPPPSSNILKLTNPLMRGNEVRQLQEALRNAGIRVGTDGVFGPDTERAVKEFQLNRGMTADGIVGPATTRALKL
ncbi:peptidoglycan-binding protein [Spirulina major]|uniref:peptidoglycan-binding protein n=1 Tax=Spirulina major TaxID=270636 RepID=UPI000933A403|nr:peptidoglycan-binding protein [Spirulina major]